MKPTREAQLRMLIMLEQQDLHQFELNPEENTTSIETTNRNIERYEAELALHPPD